MFIEKNNGSILLMVLVIVSILMVIFISSVGLISRELHTTSDATQKERIYQVAEAGMQRVLFLVKDAGYTLDQMSTPGIVSGTVTSVTDPATGSPIGSYALTISKLADNDGLNVSSIARSEDLQFCTQVTSVIQSSPPGSSTGPFLAYAWNRSACPVDTTAPTVTITSSSSNPTATSPIPITITFSEAVTGFDIGDILVTNGTADNFSGAGTTYTANITPISQGTVTVNIAAGVASDFAGNTNTAAPAFTRTYDTIAPTVVTRNPLDNATGVTATTNFVMTFSETVTSVATKNLLIKRTSDNATIETISVTGALVSGSGTSTITVNPASVLASSTSYYILIDSGAFKDAANNNYAGITITTTWNFTTL